MQIKKWEHCGKWWENLRVIRELSLVFSLMKFYCTYKEELCPSLQKVFYISKINNLWGWMKSRTSLWVYMISAKKNGSCHTKSDILIQNY